MSEFKIWILTLALLLNLVAQVAAGPIEDAGMALRGGDHTTAIRILHPPAEKGNAAAQGILGAIYYKDVVPPDYVKAAYRSRKAAEQGLRKSQVLLGTMYGLGKGVPQDYVQAYMWVSRAAANGDDQAPGLLKSIEPLMTTTQIAEAKRLAAAPASAKAPPASAKTPPVTATKPPAQAAQQPAQAKACSNIAGSQEVNLIEVAAALREGYCASPQSSASSSWSQSTWSPFSLDDSGCTDFKKREFETTAQYKARLKPKLAAVDGLVTKTGQEMLIFSLPMTDASDGVSLPLRTSYDADKRIMKFDETYSSIYSDYTIFSNRRETGSYIGSNAFGVQKVITKIEVDLIKVHIEPTLRFKPFQLSMDAGHAESVKNNGAMLVAARPRPPYFSFSKDHESPTIDLPYDALFKRETVYLKAECAVIVDQATKEVVRHLDVPPHP